jgi:hypothetical protein
MRCRAQKRLKDITTEVVVFCDLEHEHLEDFHYDQYNDVEWRVKRHETVPAPAIDSPTPHLTMYKFWSAPTEHLARDEVMVG